MCRSAHEDNGDCITALLEHENRKQLSEYNMNTEIYQDTLTRETQEELNSAKYQIQW